MLEPGKWGNAVSQDLTTALQPGQQSMTLSQTKQNKKQTNKVTSINMEDLKKKTIMLREKRKLPKGTKSKKYIKLKNMQKEFLHV